MFFLYFMKQLLSETNAILAKSFLTREKHTLKIVGRFAFQIVVKNWISLVQLLWAIGKAVKKGESKLWLKRLTTPRMSSIQAGRFCQTKKKQTMLWFWATYIMFLQRIDSHKALGKSAERHYSIGNSAEDVRLENRTVASAGFKLGQKFRIREKRKEHVKPEFKFLNEFLIRDLRTGIHDELTAASDFP